MRKYLLDEHIDPQLQMGLLRHMPEMMVWRIGDPGAPPLQSGDGDILRWCEAKGFTLVTNNRASMPGHLREHLLAGGHVSGIFILRRNFGMGAIIDELVLIWEAADPDEYTDQIVYVPL